MAFRSAWISIGAGRISLASSRPICAALSTQEPTMLVMLRMLKTLSRAIAEAKNAAHRARADVARDSVPAVSARAA
jgi:hypothetical protein